ncbi:MAG: putative phage cell wall peptidase, NlpC/P60 family [Rhodobacteraceae bacterium HLUCCA12]|nr:MAG: putative phage cell wall peptidase, NlpC/P60 family [Rhodobacteraceae bacterium HLUCCA12]
MRPDDASDLVALARGWIGTPYRHQASVRGAGCDCLGLIRGLWRDWHGAEPETPPPYGADWSETGAGESLWQALERHMRPVPGRAPWQVGQVLLFRMRQRRMAKHLGLLSRLGPDGAIAGAAFIHAYDRHGVIESPLGLPWARRIVARFEMI